jgi:hypothetical protein
MTPSPECRNGRELLNFARGQSNPRDKIHPATLPDNESVALSAPEVCFNVLFVPSKDLPWGVSVEGGVLYLKTFVICFQGHCSLNLGG